MPILDRLTSYFSPDYQAAQDKFRAACLAEGLTVEEYRHPLKGMSGEALATLVARVGPADAQNLVIVISGTHGLEGLAGSGCQIAWLNHGFASRPDDTAVLLVHLLNPWGCSWQRRQTEENADLNRNFLDRSRPLPLNDAYPAFHAVLAGTSSITPAEEDASVEAYFENRDFAEAAGGLMMGQVEYPDGMGFCGSSASWSQETLGAILDLHAAEAKRVAVVDLHTGLGPYGHGLLLSLAEPGSDELARARKWLGPSLCAVKEGEGSYPTHGELLSWVSKRVPGECTGFVIEYGTYDLRRLVMLQIDDTRIWREGMEQSPRAAEVRRNLSAFFYPATEDWLQSVAFRALQVLEMAIRGLRRG